MVLSIFVLSFFPRGVLDEILNLIESVSEGFLPTLGHTGRWGVHVRIARANGED